MTNYISEGYLNLKVIEGSGLDNNNQPFPYVHIKLDGVRLFWEKGKSGNQMYYPMLIITSPDGDVHLQGWGDYYDLYANTIENPRRTHPQRQTFGGSSQESCLSLCFCLHPEWCHANASSRIAGVRFVIFI